MTTMPDFLCHYYACKRGLFCNLADLFLDEAEMALNQIREHSEFHEVQIWDDKPIAHCPEVGLA